MTKPKTITLGKMSGPELLCNRLCGPLIKV